jgi:hypothetical protein
VIVYRLTSARFPQGRWNSKGRAAATQSLAALEILAHAAALGEDYVAIAIEIPTDLAHRRNAQRRSGAFGTWPTPGRRATGGWTLRISHIAVLPTVTELERIEPFSTFTSRGPTPARVAEGRVCTGHHCPAIPAAPRYQVLIR